MSKQTDETECEVCGSLGFELSDGLFFCSECGTQSQDVREEVAEQEENSSFVRTLKTPAKKKEPNTTQLPNDITLLEKMQMILQLQCDALLDLGYDSSLKEAAKCLWFVYLKHFGYAFQDDTATATPSSPLPATPSSPLPATPSSPLPATPSSPLPATPSSPLPATPSPPLPATPSSPSPTTPTFSTPRISKRRTRSDKDESSTPASKRQKVKNKGKVSRAAEVAAAEFDEYPEDSFLFKSSQNSLVEEEGLMVEEGEQLTKEKRGGKWCTDKDEKRLSGNELYLLRRRSKLQTVQYFSVRYTVGLVYLALLFTCQRILLCDFSRLVALNKFPYHNLHTLLPRHFTTGMESFSTYGRHQITANGIHSLAQDLYASLPLPKLPFDPKWICHTLLDRLQLPPCFHTMLDRALAGIYWPEHHRLVVAMRGRLAKEKRLDVECMALIVVLIKMTYRLDDVYEFEQESKVISSAPGNGSSLEPDLSRCVYIWEDWVTVLCRHMQQTLDKGVPLTARELDLVSDYQNYLDFCRLEIFSKVRPKPRQQDWHRRWQFNPEYYAKVSGVFKQHLLNLKEREPDTESKSLKTAEVYSWDDFVPRLIPLTALLEDSDHAPWRQYFATPAVADKNHPEQDIELLSNSMVLLLQLCSDVVDTSIVDLMQWVRHVEWEIIKGPLDAITTQSSSCPPTAPQGAIPTSSSP